MYKFLKRVPRYKEWPMITSTRCLSSSEVATALRPFYFAVHPDLFGQYPDQRVVNENSLKQLSSFLTALHSQSPVKPVQIQFYLRKDTNKRGIFELIKISLSGRDTRATVINILKSCNLPTSFVDQIQPKPSSNKNGYKTTTPDFKCQDKKYPEYSDEDDFLHDVLFGTKRMKNEIEKRQDELHLKRWLSKNVDLAKTRSDAGKPMEEEINRMRESLIKVLDLKNIKWDCGWNITHFRGCLEAFQDLQKHYPDVLSVLKGRTIVFAPFTGVSLEGDVLLNTGDVRYNWLDLIRNVKSYNEALLKIPSFEKTVSQVLLGIKIGRRKFMPRIMVREYEKHLISITTTLNDYKSFNKYPKHWPCSLKNYEIVVETEAGPLMLSPTGQFIVPSSCPGFLLVNFISENLDEAAKRLEEYKKNKYVEKTLHEEVIQKLGLSGLHKDDCITPDLMIQCCEKLLKHQHELANFKNLNLYITTYYSVFSTGVVCIPWNWNL